MTHHTGSDEGRVLWLGDPSECCGHAQRRTFRDGDGGHVKCLECGKNLGSPTPGPRSGRRPGRTTAGGVVGLSEAEREACEPDSLFPELHAAPKGSDECYTPKWVFAAMGLEFDLDVAAPPGGPWHVPTKRYFTAEDDGLAHRWDGLVWCNPPFSNFKPWAYRWANCARGVLLGSYAPETYATPEVFGAAEAVAFVGVKFALPGGGWIKPRHGCYVAFRGVGAAPAERLAAADPYGCVLYGGSE